MAMSLKQKREQWALYKRRHRAKRRKETTGEEQPLLLRRPRRYVSVGERELKRDFRPVPGTDEQYYVDQKGTVISRRYRPAFPGKWLVLRPRIHPPGGYRRVDLYLAGEKRKRFVSVGRLVLESWVGLAPSWKHVAVRLDEDPLNDSLANLRWGVRGEWW